MSEADPPEIPAGRRLVRLGGDKGLSLGERLAAQFTRLTWRTPLHALRLRGRFPLKLLAVPTDPFPGDPAAVQQLAMLDDADWAAPDSANTRLLRFAWLRDAAALPDRGQATALAERAMRAWLAAHADTVAEPVWNPAHCGWRILNWVAHAPLILSSTDLVYRSAVLNTLARMARHLDRSAERAPTGNARLAAWAGVVAAGLLIPGGDVRLSIGESGLARALASAFGDDGGVVTRSPLDQIEAIELLTLLAAAYASRNAELPEALDGARTRAVAALLGLTMGDGALSSWQGAGPVSATKIASLVDASGVRTRPLRAARDWGYQRLVAGSTIVVVDAAPPPPSRLGGIGCASTLSFELSDSAQRLIVNCGGAGSPALPPELARGLRSTAAHSTLAIDERNSTAILEDGSLGAGVGTVELDRREIDGGSRLDTAHDGYARRLGFIHKRSLILSANGRELRGDDALLPAPRRKRAASLPFAIRFHLAPGVEATPTADGQAALLRIDHGPLWQFRCRGGTLTVEESLWIDEHGMPRPTLQFVVSGQVPGGGTSVSWLLKRAG